MKQLKDFINEAKSWNSVHLSKKEVNELFKKYNLSKLQNKLIDFDGFYKGYEAYEWDIKDLNKLKTKTHQSNYGYSDEKHVLKFVNFVKKTCKDKSLSKVFVIGGYDKDGKDGILIFYNTKPYEYSLYKNSTSSGILKSENEEDLINDIDNWIIEN